MAKVKPISDLYAENTLLREALKFYAEGYWPENYPGGVLYAKDGEYNWLDYGDVARDTLKELDK